jgi:hypothetical protein
MKEMKGREEGRKWIERGEKKGHKVIFLHEYTKISGAPVFCVGYKVR